MARPRGAVKIDRLTEAPLRADRARIRAEGHGNDEQGPLHLPRIADLLAAGATGRPGNAGRRSPDRQRRYRRRGDEPERTRGRRLGHRRDERPRHEIRQDGRDGRSRAVRDPRPPAGDVRRVGARVRTGRFAEGQEPARAGPELERGGGAERGGRGRILSGHLLVLHAQDSRQAPVSGHGPRGQRHARRVQNTGAVAQRGAAERLRQLSSAGRQSDARDPGGAGRGQGLVRRGVDATAPIGTGRRDDGQNHRDPQHQRRRPPSPAGGVDGSHPRRRAAGVDAVAAARRRAQPRRHRVRLALAEVLHPRSDRDRPPQAHGQRVRSDLRRRGAQHRPPADSRPGEDNEDHDARTGARSGRAQLGARQSGGRAVTVLRGRAGVGLAGERAQSDDGPGRTRLLHPAIRRRRRTRSRERRMDSCRTPVRSRSTTRRPGSSRSSTRASARTT